MNGPTNPYIAGNPITGTEMFFGRQDVFRFVRETLVGRYRDNAVVLFGGRRTGKTSVLYQMARHLSPRYAPVFVDLQGISLEGLGEMLWGIARQAARELRRRKGIKLTVPPRDEFAGDPEGCFREGFLDPALQALGDDHLLLMLDETARLHEQVQAGRMERRVFDCLRSLIQHYPRLNFIFSIGSGLEEMRQDYALLFNPCQYRKISFLDRDAAEALITKPVEEHYRYAPGAVERILQVTHGHPYYTQLICNRLFARWARQGGDQMTVPDVEAVLPEATEQGMASLQYAWEEASDAAKIVLAALAESMGDSNRPVSLDDLRALMSAQEIPLPRRATSGALRELVAREVLHLINGGYAFTVDLMRLWIQQYQRLEWVKSKFLLPGEVSAPGRDRIRMALVGVSGALLVLLIGLFVILSRNAESARLQREGTATAMSGTIAALETAIAQGAGGYAEAQLAVIQTQNAEMQLTQQIPTDTPIPTFTPTPIPTPDLTATAIAACVFDSQVVTDTPILPSVLMPGQQFVKRWEIENTGTCPWPENIALVFDSGDELEVVDVSVIGSLAPEGSAEIEITLQAPQDFGSYTSKWRLQDGAGNPIGEELEISCSVGPTPTPTPLPPTATPEITIGTLVFSSVPTMAEWDKNAEGQWWGWAVFTVSGGDGNYRYYMNGIREDLELFEPRIFIEAQKCKPWGPNTVIVLSGDGQEAIWEGTIPYPDQHKCD